MPMPKKLVLIDSNAIIHRAYHSIPKTFSNRKGEKTNAVYGFTTTFIKVLEDLKPDYVIAAFDVGKATFRTEQFAEYKAQRVAADQDLYDQIPRVRLVLNALNIPVVDYEGYEADDCIGTIINKIKKKEKGIESYIVTGDKDLFQLLNGEIFVYWLKKGLAESQIVGSKEINEIFSLDPHDFIDLKALAGDPSDNIPGVPGIGPKTATALIQQFDSMEKLYDKIDQLSHSERSEKSMERISHRDPSAMPQDDKIIMSKDDELKAASHELDIKPRILQLLIEYKNQAFLSHKLATIYKEVPIEFDLEKCRWGDYDKEKLKELFEELGFKSLLKRFGVLPAEEPKTKEAKEQKKKDEQLKLL